VQSFSVMPNDKGQRDAGVTKYERFHRAEARERAERQRRRIERDKRQRCVCWDYETPDADCTCGAMD
jgi:hypothetical protein